MQLRSLQLKATPIDAPEESHPQVRLKNSLELYCFNLRRTKDKKQILFGRPYHEEIDKILHVKFMFDPFYKYLKTNNWEPTENITHQMIKKLTGISREKLHINDEQKKWVYVLDSKKFNSEEIKGDSIDFEQNDKAPY